MEWELGEVCDCETNTKNECMIEQEKRKGIEGQKNGLWANPRLNQVDEDGKGWNGSGRIIFKEIGG